VDITWKVLHGYQEAESFINRVVTYATLIVVSASTNRHEPLSGDFKHSLL
jgi:hypothetical protein